MPAWTDIRLQQLALNESGVRVPTETVLRAAALFLAEQGRPAMQAEVQDHSFHGAELLDGPEVLVDHLRWRDIALERSIPLHEYRGLDMISV